MTGATDPLVSVVIPSHNRPELVAAAVASVLDQQIPTEVIVIDDASEPPLSKTGPLADPAVHLIRNATAGGPTRARNQGIEAATGDFVAFLDDDDTWLPGKLRRTIDAAGAGPAQAVVAHRTTDDPRHANRRTGEPPRVISDPLRRFGRNQTPHLDSLLVDAKLAKSVMFDESFRAAEDVDFVLELARRVPFVLLEDVLAVRTQDDPTAIGIEARIAGRRQLRTKHSDVLYVDGPSRAFYNVRMGHLHLAARQRLAALRHFGRAIRYQPVDRRGWNGVVATFLPRRLRRTISFQLRAGGARDVE